MADDNSAGSFAEAKRRLTDNVERNIERSGRVAAQLDKTLISLSAGALVFSMTFVSAFTPGKLLLPLLFLAWGAFAACMMLVIFAMRAEQNAMTAATQDLDSLLQQLDKHEPLVSAAKLNVKLTYTVSAAPRVVRLNKCAIGAFMVGVGFLGLFVGYDLSQSS
jgi:hypothetical protein